MEPRDDVAFGFGAVMQLNLLVLSYVASAAVSAAVAVVAWRRRQMVGARGLALLMLAVCWWLLANVFEASALDRSAKIVWSVVSYPGIESAPVLYLLFVLGWTRQDRWLTRGRIALLLLLPIGRSRPAHVPGQELAANRAPVRLASRRQDGVGAASKSAWRVALNLAISASRSRLPLLCSSA